MLKGLDGVRTHAHREWVPIVPNDQDMPRLAQVVGGTLDEHPSAHAILLQRHGLYTWGATLADAVRHVEILEFLFETIGRTRDVPVTRRTSMALLKIPEENRTLTDADTVRGFLAEHGIEYERTGAPPGLSARLDADEILAAWTPKIDELKARGGYVIADVIDVKPDTPNLDAMLKRFSQRALARRGRGPPHRRGTRTLPHPSARASPVFALEVEAGDLIRVPRGTHHWFDLCGDRRIRAIRLFQDKSGLDAALHRERRGREVPAALLRPGVHSRRARRSRRRACDGRVRLARRARRGARHRGHHDADLVRLRRAVPVRAHAPARRFCDARAVGPAGRGGPAAPGGTRRGRRARQRATAAAGGREQRERGGPRAVRRSGSWTATASLPGSSCSRGSIWQRGFADGTLRASSSPTSPRPWTAGARA